MNLLVCLLIFVVLLVMGAPIILCLGIPSTVWLLISGSIPNLVMAQKMFTACDSFSLMAIPFFMLAGQIMERTGITEAIVEFANACIGWIRGGFACAVELAGMIMAGISGSSNADASALGSICLRALRKSGYEEGWAAAIVCSASGIGPIIPPSIIMIIYANAAGLNIGKLFMGGIIPGIGLGVAYMLVAANYARRKGIPTTPFQGFRNLGKKFLKAVWALFMPVIIIVGILTGVFTATEAGVTAAIYGVAYGLLTKKLNLGGFVDSLRDAVISATGPVSLIAVSSMFSYMLAREGVTAAIGNFCTANIHSQFAMLIFVVLVCVVAGCFVDGTAIMLLMTPIFLPVIKQMGIDVQQFSIIFMIAIMSGGMTPPVGSMLFIISGIDNTPISKMVKPILPFIGALMAVILLMIIFPQISGWLPSVLGY